MGGRENEERTTSVRLYEQDAVTIRLCAAYFGVTAAEFVRRRFRVMMGEVAFVDLPAELVALIHRHRNDREE